MARVVVHSRVQQVLLGNEYLWQKVTFVNALFVTHRILLSTRIHFGVCARFVLILLFCAFPGASKILFPLQIYSFFSKYFNMLFFSFRTTPCPAGCVLMMVIKANNCILLIFHVMHGRLVSFRSYCPSGSDAIPCPAGYVV